MPGAAERATLRGARRLAKERLKERASARQGSTGIAMANASPATTRSLKGR
jgi:hypothetical protein